MKASVYIATSLDGFIARENGDTDWLEEAAKVDGEDYSYKRVSKKRFHEPSRARKIAVLAAETRPLSDGRGSDKAF